MIRISINGLIKISLFVFSLNIFFTSCRSFKQDLSQSNHFNEDYFYNDSVKISIDFWGGMEFQNNNKLIRKIKRKNKYFSNTKFLLFYASKINNYNICIFYDSIKFEDNTYHKKIIFQDTINNISIFEKTKGRKRVLLYVQSNGKYKKYSEIIGNDLLNRIIIDSCDNAKLSSLSFFNNYALKNCLQARKKIEKSSFEKLIYKGLKWQLLATVNSFMSNNFVYDTIIKTYEKKRKEKYTVFVDSISLNKDVYVDDQVYKQIGNLASQNNVIFLNEDHYYPKHRVFGLKILEILREEGFKYLSLEDFKDDDKINLVPNRNNGIYINEPYFANFVRRAKELGFVIVGHESLENNIDRELGQAQNIFNILKNDSQAKILAYVGHSHIEKGDGNKKWMAQYFKELSGINPITINQVAVCSEINQELTLIPRIYFENYPGLKSSADYFLINNIKPTLEKVFSSSVFKDVEIKSNSFKKNKNKEVLVEINDLSEFKLIRGLAIPIENRLETLIGKSINLELPLGKYHIFVKTEDNKIIYENDLILN